MAENDTSLVYSFQKAEIEKTGYTILRIAQQTKNSAIESFLSEVLDKLAKEEFYLALLGLFKRGKSTLINALLGQPIIPTGVIPVTSVITRIRYGNNLSAKIKFSDGSEKKKSLVDAQGEKGYLSWAICSSNDSQAELSFLSDGNLLSEDLLTAKDIFVLGLVAPNPIGLWVPRYDVINNIYVMAFTPPAPWPFSESLKISIKPTKSILHVHSFEHSAINIVDEALFKSSLLDISTQPIPKQV
jgi:hypothetical protein